MNINQLRDLVWQQEYKNGKHKNLYDSDSHSESGDSSTDKDEDENSDIEEDTEVENDKEISKSIKEKIVVSENSESSESDIMDIDSNINRLVKKYAPKEDNCEHYTNYCKIVSTCCNKPYHCIKCHNNKEKHEINKSVNLICKNCSLEQSINDKCIACETVFGFFSCSKCVVYSDIYEAFHCEKCNRCRSGRKEYYSHCNTCKVCYYNEDKKFKHECNRIKDNCVICMDLFKFENKEIVITRCEHVYHKECLDMYKQQGAFKCPLCLKSVTNMTEEFNNIDNDINNQELNEIFKDTVKIRCNDCNAYSSVMFHHAGLKCLNCDSYNTNAE